MNAYVTTNGCSLGRLKTMQVREFLRRNDPSIQFTDTATEAQLVVFFACGLTDVSEQASVKVIRHIKEEIGSTTKLVVWGCLAKINPEALRSLYDGPTVGPRNDTFFDGLLDDVQVPFASVSANTLVEQGDRFCGIRYKSSAKDAMIRRATRALNKVADHRDSSPVFYIRITDGCLGNCTYCSEKLAWGRLKSRPMEAVLSEFEDGLARGYTRFFLCSEDVGAYGVDTGSSCGELLQTITRRFPSERYSIIIDQITPQFLVSQFEELRPVFATGRIETIGCQVQSGSNRVLERMNRPYRAEEWRSAMTKVAAEFPQIRLQSHFMVGFPGETEDDFRMTLRLLDWPLFIQSCNVYVFSPKSRVKASKLPNQVPDSIKVGRRARLFRKQMLMSMVYRMTGQSRRTRAARARVNQETGNIGTGTPHSASLSR